MKKVLMGINIDKEIKKKLAWLKRFWPDLSEGDLILLGLIQLHTHTIDAYLPCSLDEILRKTLEESEA